MANTAIGEAVIYFGGAEYTLRPSLYAMQQIGTPEDIERAAIDVFLSVEKLLLCEPLTRHDMQACVSVLQACALEPLPVELVGEVVGDDYQSLKWKYGAADPLDIATIAHQMISYGINGKPDKDRMAVAARRAAKEGEDPKPFDPLEFVGTAIAHLGLSTDDAWRLTMVEFQRAIDSKFPLDKKDKNQMTKDELRAVMAL